MTNSEDEIMNFYHHKGTVLFVEIEVPQHPVILIGAASLLENWRATNRFHVGARS